MRRRMTWDEMKRAADGGLNPRNPEQPPGVEDFREKHQRLKSEWRDAQTDAEEAQMRADELYGELKALEDRMATLGIDPA